MTAPSLEIAGRAVGPVQPPHCVAEMPGDTTATSIEP